MQQLKCCTHRCSSVFFSSATPLSAATLSSSACERNQRKKAKEGAENNNNLPSVKLFPRLHLDMGQEHMRALFDRPCKRRSLWLG
jgi:hypothetical protein